MGRGFNSIGTEKPNGITGDNAGFREEAWRMTAMKSQPKTILARREFLRTLGAGATLAAASSGPLANAAKADTENNDEKRRARYQANSPEVQTYYRVNRYPS
jgi:hypothetical protein